MKINEKIYMFGVFLDRDQISNPFKTLEWKDDTSLQAFSQSFSNN
jgi:hypothetical protein